jgi:HD-like signal output (HDOD) protein/CheY-like chemotaxis protein
MKRILFVDDDPSVLRGLERTLYPMRVEWEMSFVETGRQALTLMTERPFDVVVTDMRMPGMNGNELLNEVMHRFPRTVRIILSGHADTELILRCVGSTHQFLSKPCEPAVLQAVVERAASLDRVLKHEPLRKLTARMKRLPSLPSLFTQIVRKLQSPEADAEEIAAIVNQDVGLMAKLLQVVNSAFFGLRHDVSSPVEAVSYLGTNTIKSIVLTIETFRDFEDVVCPGFSHEELWLHCNQTATAARAIAQAEGSNARVADEAYCAALLHDSGKLVLAGNFGESYASVLALARTQSRPLPDCEKHAFGATHASVGGFLLGLWGLPAPIVEAVALHHEPVLSVERSFCPLTAVHAANAFVREWHDTSGRGIPPSPLDLGYLEAIGLAGQIPAWRDAAGEALNAVQLP